MPLPTQSLKSLPPAVRHLLSDLGKRVRQARIARGKTQAEVADAAFVDRRTILRVERGEPSIGLGVLASVLYVLGQERSLERVAEISSDAIVRQAIAKRMPRAARRSRASTRTLDF